MLGEEARNIEHLVGTSKIIKSVKQEGSLPYLGIWGI
jgi:hypothetical protein